MQYEKETWRLLKMPPAQGAWNMAVDESILHGIYIGDSLPTLRLYSWSPPCFSLGYAQPYSDVNEEFLTTAGWQLVRRPTGGRAILHTDELTYAVIGPNDEPRLAGGVLESYSRLASALLQALILLGLPAESKETYIKQSQSNNQNPVCFEVPSNYEITVNEKKLIGSAQARRKEGILQHGSLPLTGDITRILSALFYENDEAQMASASRLLTRATTVERELGYSITWEKAASAVIQAFETVLNLKLVPGELTSFEAERADQLMQEKYGHDSWTFRV
ncbi:MAG: lipoate--protein ligase family protein [Anaerolineaceae bacterium]|nr:lipoate--protein ligase family protein [Anaerolineaceae bacterium]